MRCPYCGGVNSDRADYCIHCGRNLTSQASNQPPYQQPRQVQGRPANVPQPPYQQPRQAPQPVQGGRQPSPSRPGAPVTRQPVPPTPVAPPSPEPPAPFPPRNVADLQALEQGALPYNVVDSTIGNGRKKIVRISFAKGVAWQQVATLLKAFKEQQEEKFESIIIQGISGQDANIYSFTNGQLTFDRNVRLGSTITNRYQIETGNGYESDSLRIVLNE
jgi:hypothetical protein